MKLAAVPIATVCVEAGCVVAGLTACLFAWNTDYLFAMVLMMASGWCTVKIVTVSHAMLQMIVPNAIKVTGCAE